MSSLARLTTASKLDARNGFRMLVIATLYAMLAAGAFFMLNPIPYADSALFEYIGRSLAHGQRLYVDVWDNKLPGAYLFDALWHRTLGENYAAHVLAEIALNFATAGFFFDFCRRTGVRAATAAALLCAAMLVLWPVGLNTTENYAIFAIVIGYWSWSRSWYAAAGIALAVAAFCWIPSVLAMLPMLVTMQDGKGRLQVMLAFAVVLGLEAAALTLLVSPKIVSELIHSWFDYVGDSKIHQSASSALAARALRGFAASGLALPLSYLALVLERPRTAAQRFALVWLGTSLVGACATANFYPHYFVPTIPAAVYAAFCFARNPERRVARMLIAAIVLGATASSVVSYWQLRWQDTHRDPFLARVASDLQPAAAENVRVFVEGFRPEIFLIAGVLPTDRFELDRAVNRFAATASDSGSAQMSATVLVLQGAGASRRAKLERSGFTQACRAPMPIFVRRSADGGALAARIAARCEAEPNAST